MNPEFHRFNRTDGRYIVSFADLRAVSSVVSGLGIEIFFFRAERHFGRACLRESAILVEVKNINVGPFVAYEILLMDILYISYIVIVTLSCFLRCTSMSNIYFEYTFLLS